MQKLIIPQNYFPKLNNYQLQLAIEQIKKTFQQELSKRLNLKRVSAPLFVEANTGINDNLSGSEHPVSFSIPSIDMRAEIVHSLVKWKRIALQKYGFSTHEGLVTDMNAIRRDEITDNLHSVYVDQWDWEKIILPADRTIDYLQQTVKLIVQAISATELTIHNTFGQLTDKINEQVTFINAQQLEDMYPTLSTEERELQFTKRHKTVFIMKIGDKLQSGTVHSSRSPDYDDWQLNGDLLCWSNVLNMPIELSSMGIRVDAKSLIEQLEKSNCLNRKHHLYHSMLLNNQLPLTIGGGIGQSRLCMLLLQCAHIGEVQVSVWDKETLDACQKHNIPLL